MPANTGLKAAIAFFAWIAIGLVAGFLIRDAITRVLGPDVWFLAALWAGTLLGLINVLGVLILGRR